MKKIAIISAIGAATFLSAPAFAQEEITPQVYVGASAGYHDLALGTDNDDGAIFGGYIGVDVPLGEILIVGAEANYNIGTDAIDSEYGIIGKVGVNVGNGGQLFLRGGYQEVNLDLDNIIGAPVPGGIDDTEGDYLLGVGGQIKVSERVRLRAVLDTIAFDTTRATVGLQFNF